MRRMITGKQQEALNFIETTNANGQPILTEIRFNEPISQYVGETYIQYNANNSKDLDIKSRGKVAISGDNGIDVAQHIFVALNDTQDVDIWGGYNSEIDDGVVFTSFNDDGFVVRTWNETEEDYTERLHVDKEGHILMVIPTSDPHVAGALWNDNGTLKISAGGN